jgi:hypothetical protein
MGQLYSIPKSVWQSAKLIISGHPQDNLNTRLNRMIKKSDWQRILLGGMTRDIGYPSSKHNTQISLAGCQTDLGFRKLRVIQDRVWNPAKREMPKEAAGNDKKHYKTMIKKDKTKAFGRVSDSPLLTDKKRVEYFQPLPISVLQPS